MPDIASLVASADFVAWSSVADMMDVSLDCGYGWCSEEPGSYP